MMSYDFETFYRNEIEHRDSTINTEDPKEVAKAVYLALNAGECEVCNSLDTECKYCGEKLRCPECGS